MDFPATSFEERLTSHKVVTTPEDRRPRSLSAGRSRQRAVDLVQNLYDRMGVNYQPYQRGQDSTNEYLAGATSLSTSVSTARNGTENIRATYSQSHLVRGTASSTQSSRMESTQASVGNSHAVFARQHSQDCEPGEIQQSRSFHERYRAATTTSSSRGREHINSSKFDDFMDGRPRSLSRGRVAHLWPPPQRGHNEHAATAAAIISEAPVPPPPPPPPPPPATKHQYSAEEKKEEEPPTSNPVSLKDRISVFGSPKGANSKAKAKPKRAVDPKYLAQFSVRDLPPKVNIYAHSSSGASPKDTTTVLEAGTDPSTLNDAFRTSSHGFSATTKSSGNKTGGIAQAYMSAIQPSSTMATKSPKTSSSGKATIPPPREIDLGLLPNDSQSFTGVSTVSGDEYPPGGNNSSKRPIWRTGAPPNTSTVAAGTNSSSNNHGFLPSAPLTSSDDAALDRLVEARVKERMSDLESKMDARLRQLVTAMESRIMTRLETMERKLTQER